MPLLVVDHYGRGAAFEHGCRPWAATILVIDDLADRRHCVDRLLDQTHGREEADYRLLTGPDCRLLLGARFALLRPQFQAYRPGALARRGSDGPAQRLLVSFGATDSGGATMLALQGVALGCPGLQVDVVVGSFSRNRDEIDHLAARLSPAVTVHRSVSDMASLMTDADFAIGAAGGTSWERCCLGLPTLVVVTADNQRDIARSLAAAGAIDLVGDAGHGDRGGPRRPDNRAVRRCPPTLRHGAGGGGDLRWAGYSQGVRRLDARSYANGCVPRIRRHLFGEGLMRLRLLSALHARPCM